MLRVSWVGFFRLQRLSARTTPVSSTRRYRPAMNRSPIKGRRPWRLGVRRAAAGPLLRRAILTSMRLGLIERVAAFDLCFRLGC